jgi:hypothetical protein
MCEILKTREVKREKDSSSSRGSYSYSSLHWTGDGMVQGGHSQFSFLLAMGSSSLMIWCTFPLITITSKCLLTTMDQCSRWGPENGTNFHYPVTVAALNLLLVGGFLMFVIPLVEVKSPYSSSPIPSESSWGDVEIASDSDSEGDSYDERNENLVTGTVDEGNEDRMLLSTALSPVLDGSYDVDDDEMTTMIRPRLQQKLETCAVLGIAFAAKYVTAHLALSMTPTILYELFHCSNILVLVICAYMILGESIQTVYQVIGCAGILLGSVMTTLQSLIESSSNMTPHSGGRNSSGSMFESLLMMLFINILNGFLAGLCVVLLKKAMQTNICESALEVSCSGGTLFFGKKMF